MIQSSLFHALKSSFPYQILITQDDKESYLASEVARFYGYEVFLFPDFRAKRGDDLRSYKEELLALLGALRAWYNAPKNRALLIAPLHSLLYPLPKADYLQSFTLGFGDTLEIKALEERFYRYGYEFVEIIELPGEVSFRGDIIDIYPPQAPAPLRLSLFDTQIESIRRFSLETQLCEREEIERVEIAPVLLALNETEQEELEELVSASSYGAFSKDLMSLGLWYLREKGVWLPGLYPAILTPNAKEELGELASLSDSSEERLESLPRFEGMEILNTPAGFSDILISPANFLSFLSLHASKKITLIARNEALFRSFNAPSESENLKYHLGDFHINILTPTEAILSLNGGGKKRAKKPRASLAIDELKLNDYVVHKDYGIGIFKGIVQEHVLGATRDFIQLAYQGEDRLLLPVENLNYIDRYVADSGSIPALDRLGKGSFARLKEKVRGKLLEMASEIVAMAAKRELIQGHTLKTDFPEIAIFQHSSGFEYTRDQERSIGEIFADLESGKVMDRLLSGDVGFGKTEVAMNAILSAVLSGYQAAFVAPTTLLAHQHFQSLKRRFEGYGVKLARLDRFLSAKERASLLKALEEGSVDVVVGTHAILSAVFKNLALIVVDEEHKFGVKQKERIKAIAQDVHMLSMSATPIPRTLNMALSHIKGMSTLLTPPSEKLAVRTFIKEYQEPLLKEVISRELRRGGQVFYIHNNIATIERRQQELLELLPSLKIAILHSQISEKETEEVMFGFEEGRYHVLLSTSIIESGIHLPNANTIIVDSSDRFGIADLHQLRGRVGRGSKEGFCYFLVEDKESLTPESKKRLLALESNSFLGSGSVLAYHDLEIRGGGNLLGEAQSGHIKGIGYALYLKMLEEAIHSLSASAQPLHDEVELKLTVSGFLSPELIESDRLRLELYRRLSRAHEVEEVNEIEVEINDRFGTPERYTKQFLELIRVKILASKAGIKSISNFNQTITFFYPEERKHSFSAASRDDDDILEAIMKELAKEGA